jgi:hypothetical protein
MKAYLVIKNRDNTVVFEGKALTLPIKEDAMKKKSMEVFRDPDPCIIHQSYVTQTLVESLLDYIPKGICVLGKDIPLDLSFIALEDVLHLSFYRKE